MGETNCMGMDKSGRRDFFVLQHVSSRGVNLQKK